MSAHCNYENNYGPAGQHSAGWTMDSAFRDGYALQEDAPMRLGRHVGLPASKVGRHHPLHPATPVTYDAAGTTTPLVTAAPVLDVVA